jgi:RNA polymerase sigma-70 factor (ECF subfamily)
VKADLARGASLPEDDKVARFERTILPHLDAAYNLARWLTGKDHDAEDVVQEAYLRAFQFFDSFHGTGGPLPRRAKGQSDGSGRAWLLTIVRNTCYTWLDHNRRREPTQTYDEETHGAATTAANPESLLVRKENQQLVRQALEELPTEFREIIVLRELEGLSYQEIAGIAAIPLGTVMSRLARARERLAEGLNREVKREV